MAEVMGRRWVAVAVAVIFLAGLAGLAKQVYAQKARTEAAQKKEVYTRPPIDRRIQPTVPKVNRYQRDKVFLEYADSLYRLPSLDMEKQILKGNVKFRQAGMWMFCDSAYYYPDYNSLDAFGHVRMEQGDTLFVYADKVFYDGNERRARLRCGPSERSVRLINRDVTLTTDSLDYDLNMEMGWYAYGGRIDDKVNTLTSIYGEYSPATKNADFYHDVELVNNKDGFRLVTDTLFYNTDTHIARIVSPTKIMGENDTILTNSGTYNTVDDNARLTSRSTIMHRDSSNNIVTLEGDSIIYDKLTRISRAYRFRDPLKHSLPMVLTDTARKSILIGGFGMYNDSTHEAMATEYPLAMEFSRPDTLFLRADTIYTSLVTRKVFPTEVITEAMAKFEAAKAAADSIAATVAADSIAVAADSLSSVGADSISIVTRTPSPVKLELDSTLMVDKEFHMAKAFRRARFFNQDMQGVADSMEFQEYDSMLYLFRKPVVWSGERQVAGNRIDVHFNDSVPDWAILPENGMMSEYIDEDFYNQLAGKMMKAYFENKELRRLEVEGNVEAIFLPQEGDSTYNRLVQAESSFMTIEMSNKEMDRVKMWPEVSGTVTPIFLVKNAQKYLQNFLWLERIRPVRAWYGNRITWDDNLGEVPEELDEYFRQPPLFPEAKKPVRPAPMAPPASVMDAAAAKIAQQIEEKQKESEQENPAIEEETNAAVEETPKPEEEVLSDE